MYALHLTPSSTRATVLPFPRTEVAPTLGTVFAGQTVETFTGGRAVFWEGDPAEHVFEVVSGVLRLYRILPEGRRAVAGFAFPGEVLGLSFRDRYALTAEAVGEVTVRRHSRSRFLAVVDDTPELRPLLFARLCDEMCAAQDQMLLLLHSSAETRLVSFLLLVARKSAGEIAKGTEIPLPMSRTDIADYLGLTIETVCRGLTRLRKAGLVVLNGPHRVVVQKPRALRDLAGEDGEPETPAEAPRTSRAAWPH